jgi:hypothetical protein
MKPIKRIRGDEVPEPVKLALDRVYEWSDQFRRIPWLDGVMVETTLAAGDNDVEHKLGRTPQGFIVVGFTGATSENYPSMVTADARFMTLNSLDVMVLKLWVWG